MDKLIDYISKNKYYIAVAALFVLGIAVRAVALGSVPGGANQDEARAAYEAWSLGTYGIDTHGYHFPVYFVSWGSGMNVLYSYALIPFIKLFGLTAFAMRIPQFLGGVATLLFIFLTLRRTAGRRAALIGLAVVATAPWHVMMSRWGLESNFAVVFLTGGVYFFVRALERPPFLMLSALFFGFALYCYSIVWLFLPLFLLITAVWCAFARVRLPLRAVLPSVAILMILAAPLVLFVLVNMGVTDEITTPFFSVPRLSAMRTGEFISSVSDLAASAKNLGMILLKQDDGLLWNSIPAFGLYYLFALPLFIAGAVSGAAQFGRALGKKEFSIFGLFFIWLIAAVVTALVLTDANINRINVLHIPVLFFIARGAYICVTRWHRAAPAVLAVLYSLFFAAFSGYYFTRYARDISVVFRSDYQELCTSIGRRAGSVSRVICDDTVEPMLLLFYTRYPTPDFVSTVVYSNAPNPWLHISSFGRYTFAADFGSLDKTAVYVIESGDIQTFISAGFSVDRCGTMAVAYIE